MATWGQIEFISSRRARSLSFRAHLSYLKLSRAFFLSSCSARYISPFRTISAATLFDASLVLLEPFLRAFPVPQAVDLLGGRLGPDADKVVAVQAVVHIDAVAVEMEVRGPGLVYSQLFVQT